MTLPRRCLLTLLALVAPGVPQAIGRRWVPAVLLGGSGIALAGLVTGWFVQAGVVSAALDPALVDRTGWAAVALGTIAAVSVTETAIHVWARPGRTTARLVGTAGVVLLAACPAAAGTAGLWYAGQHSDALTSIFPGGGTRVLPSSLRSIDDADTPLPDATIADSPSPGAVPTTAATRADSPAQTFVGEGRWNILLLGGDASRGRSGLRTDAMMLVSVDRATGDTALVSVPRNMGRLPMPEGPLRKKFPKGWPDLANALYGYVRNNPALGDGTDQAPEHAVAGAMAEALGVPIDNVVLVDMGGFIDVVDALGGVDITLTKAVPAPGNPYEAKHPVRAWFGPGRVHLDGTDALAYARSRTGDSDYRRMERQRCLLASAARQIGARDLLARWDDLLRAAERSVRTDLTPAQARELVTLYGRVDRDAIRSIGLEPPHVNTGAPDYAAVRRLVAATLDPSPEVTPPPETSAETTAGRRATTTVPAPPAPDVLDAESSC